MTQIIYTCPVCGEDLQEIALVSNPPIYKKVCHNCGWSYEEPRNNVERILFNPEFERILNNLKENHAVFSTVPLQCRSCPTHPTNGGTGICNCTLGGYK